MNKFAKTIIISFAVGLVLMGIGSGIAFAEFSQMQYMGPKPPNVPALEMTTQQERFQLANTNDTIYINCYNYVSPPDQGTSAVVADPKLKATDIVFEAILPVQSHLDINQIEHHTEDYEEFKGYTSSFDVYSYNNDGLTFNNFGEIMDDLKDNKFYSYDHVYPMQLTVKVAPQMVDKVFFNY